MKFILLLFVAQVCALAQLEPFPQPKPSKPSGLRASPTNSTIPGVVYLPDQSYVTADSRSISLHKSNVVVSVGMYDSWDTNVAQIVGATLDPNWDLKLTPMVVSCIAAVVSVMAAIYTCSYHERN